MWYDIRLYQPNAKAKPSSKQTKNISNTYTIKFVLNNCRNLSTENFSIFRLNANLHTHARDVSAQLFATWMYYSVMIIDLDILECASYLITTFMTFKLYLLVLVFSIHAHCTHIVNIIEMRRQVEWSEQRMMTTRHGEW